MASFDIIMPYWPAGSAMYWWERFNPAEVARDVELAAALDLMHLSVSLSWYEFQPGPQRTSVPAMRNLERVLTIADDRGVRVSVVLFPVRLGRLAWVPPWSLSDTREPGTPALSGHHLHRRPIRDLVHDRTMVEAQVFQVREIIHAFTGHPALAGWMLGDRVTSVCRPGSALALQEWIGTLAEAAGSAKSKEALWHAVSARELVQSSAVDLASISGQGVGVMVVDDWMPAWAEDSGHWWTAFLAAYATRLAGQPVVARLELHGAIGGSGLQTAESVERTVQLVAEMGAAGCCGMYLFDFDDRLRASPPFDEEPALLSCGALRADGGEKPWGRIWSDLSRARMHIGPVPAEFPSPDREARSRRPEAVARECFEEFTR